MADWGFGPAALEFFGILAISAIFVFLTAFEMNIVYARGAEVFQMIF